MLPYPTDLYFSGSTDGTPNIQPANSLSPNQNGLNALDGFSTTAVIRARFASPLNAASLHATARARHGPGQTIFGSHGSIIDPTSSAATTAEMQLESLGFANSLGTVIPITNTAVVQQ